MNHKIELLPFKDIAWEDIKLLQVRNESQHEMEIENRNEDSKEDLVL